MNAINASISKSIDIDLGCLSDIGLEVNENGLLVYGIVDREFGFTLKKDMSVKNFISLMQKIIDSAVAGYQSDTEIVNPNEVDTKNDFEYTVTDIHGGYRTFLLIRLHGIPQVFELTRGSTLDEMVQNLRTIKEKVGAVAATIIPPANDPVFEHDLEEMDRINQGVNHNLVPEIFTGVIAVVVLVSILGSVFN